MNVLFPLIISLESLLDDNKEVYAKMLHHGLKTEKKKKKTIQIRTKKLPAKRISPFL